MTEMDLLRTPLLGLCLGTPEASHPGHIQILGTLQKQDSGLPALEPSWQDSQLGPSRRVFWPPANPFPKTSHNGRLVRLTLERNPQYFGVDDPRRDWYQVARRDRDGQWEIEIVGHPVLSGSPDRMPGEVQLQHLRLSEWVYLQDRRAQLIFGPFVLQEDDGHRVLAEGPAGVSRLSRFEMEEIPPLSLIETPGGSQYLLGAPPPDLGEPVDTATPQVLAAWLASRFHQSLPTGLAILDREQPGWRSQLEDVIDQAVDPATRKLELARWTRLEEILNAVAQDSWHLNEALRDSPALQAHIREAEDQAVRAAVDARAEEIVREAEAIAEDWVKERDRVKAEMEEHLSGTRQTIEAALAELEVLKARRLELEAEAEPMKAVAEHLSESRDRLLKDFVAFEALLGRKQCPPNALELAPLEPGKTFTDPKLFIEQRLAPVLSTRVHGLTVEWAGTMHHALLGWRWVLVPSPGWSRGYQDALGPSCHLEIIPVESTWLSFQVVWEDHLATLWRAAIDHPDRIFLVHYQDLDRSLPEHWCRPLWNLASGLSRSVWRGVPPGWPENIRLLASLAPDDRAIPLALASLQHFAGVPHERIGSQESRFGSVSGHVPGPVWADWATNTKDRAANIDGNALIQAFRKMCATHIEPHVLSQLDAPMLPWHLLNKIALAGFPDIDTGADESSARYLVKLRFEWPQSYLTFRSPHA